MNLATLHDLACTGPTLASGCVCRRPERTAPMDRLTDAAELHRERAESIVRGMEVLARKFAKLEVVPLDVLDRAERMLVQLHASNLQRLPSYSAQELDT